MNAAHKQVLAGLVALLALATACQSEAATPTTVATTTAPTIAPPTTPAPTTTTPPTTKPAPTTAAPTTQAPTTAPPATAAATPEELLGERAVQRSVDLAKCYAAPDDCDIAAYLDDYYKPGTTARDNIQSFFDGMVRDGWRWGRIKQIDNTVIDVSTDPTGRLAKTRVCTVNRAVAINADDEIVDDEVGYLLYEMYWEISETGRWLIVDASENTIDPTGESPCDF